MLAGRRRWCVPRRWGERISPFGQPLALGEPASRSPVDAQRVASQRVSPSVPSVLRLPACRAECRRTPERRNTAQCRAHARSAGQHGRAPASPRGHPRANCRTSWTSNRRAVRGGPARFRQRGRVTWRARSPAAWPAVRPPNSCAIRAPVLERCPPRASVPAPALANGLASASGQASANGRASASVRRRRTARLDRPVGREPPRPDREPPGVAPESRRAARRNPQSGPGQPSPARLLVGLSRLGCLADHPSVSLGHVGRDDRLGRLRLERTHRLLLRRQRVLRGRFGLLRGSGRRHRPRSTRSRPNRSPPVLRRSPRTRPNGCRWACSP